MKQAKVYISIMISLAIIMGGIVFSNLGNIATEKSHLYKYTVREYNGKVAVFSLDDDMPMSVLNISVKDLPIKDRQMLINGIFADDELKLNEILQDYDG